MSFVDVIVRWQSVTSNATVAVGSAMALLP
jgi:hypothetical protein